MVLAVHLGPEPLAPQVGQISVGQVSHLLAGAAMLLFRHLELPELLRDELGGRRGLVVWNGDPDLVEKVP